jgi:hypothetical protein
MAEWQPKLQDEWRAVLNEAEGQWIWLLPAWGGSLPEAIKRQVSEARGTDRLDPNRDAQSSIDYTVKSDLHWIDPSDPGWVVEYVEAVAGSRTVSSFGAWRGLPKPEREAGERLVEAPYAPGDDPFATRYLPECDPLTNTVAVWRSIGWGPRSALRPHRPAEGRSEWLVWHADFGSPDPSLAEDDGPMAYQRRFALEPAA